MTNGSRPGVVIGLLRGTYRLLVRLYRAPFRREFGPLLVQAFDDMLRDGTRCEAGQQVPALWLAMFADLLASLVREHLDHLQEDVRTTLSPRMLFLGYAWLYGAYALVLTVATSFDVTHGGDIFNVAAALGATLGLYGYLRRTTMLPPPVWRGMFTLIVVYDLVTIFLILAAAGNDARSFHWLLGSTAPGSTAYDLIAVAAGLPGLATLWHLGRRELRTT